MSPEEINVARQKLGEVRRMMSWEQSRARGDHRVVGCYKILNAVGNVLDEMQGGEEDEEYTFTRLVEGMLNLSYHYNVTLEDAVLRIGQARTLFKQG